MASLDNATQRDGDSDAPTNKFGYWSSRMPSFDTRFGSVCPIMMAVYVSSGSKENARCLRASKST